MTKKLTILYAFAFVFACSPAFAEEDAHKGHEHSRQMKMEKMDSVSPVRKSEAETGGKAKTSRAIIRKVTAEEVGTEAVCPVTGEKLKVTAGTRSASYKGKVYYFCCPGCEKPFIATPEKYLNKKQAPQGKIYVCPMGEYQGDKPGKCPKCGMALIEKK